MSANVQHLFPQAQSSFSIIEEFANLPAVRKMVLCDHLFVEGYPSYERTVELLWPQADSDDISKLEKFLMLMKHSAH